MVWWPSLFDVLQLELKVCWFGRFHCAPFGCQSWFCLHVCAVIESQCTGGCTKSTRAHSIRWGWWMKSLEVEVEGINFYTSNVWKEKVFQCSTYGRIFNRQRQTQGYRCCDILQSRRVVTLDKKDPTRVVWRWIYVVKLFVFAGCAIEGDHLEVVEQLGVKRLLLGCFTSTFSMGFLTQSEPNFNSPAMHVHS